MTPREHTTETNRSIASGLLDIGAVSLRIDPPYTWASGRLSPIYCDNRLLISFPERRKKVTAGFKDLLEQLGWKPEIVAGTATAGIPHAAWLASSLDLPMIYVRGSSKQHGKQNRVEGRLDSGKQVVLIEDLISTGSSSIEAAKAIVESGAELFGVAAIFTYGLEAATQRFSEAGMNYAALTSFDELIQLALENGSISQPDIEILMEWQRDPAGWSISRGGAG